MFCSPKRPSRFWAPTSLQFVPRFLTEGKAAGTWCWSLTFSGTDFRIDWSYTSSSPCISSLGTTLRKSYCWLNFHCSITINSKQRHLSPNLSRNIRNFLFSGFIVWTNVKSCGTRKRKLRILKCIPENSSFVGRRFYWLLEGALARQ